MTRAAGEARVASEVTDVVLKRTAAVDAAPSTSGARVWRFPERIPDDPLTLLCGGVLIAAGARAVLAAVAACVAARVLMPEALVLAACGLGTGGIGAAVAAKALHAP